MTRKPIALASSLVLLLTACSRPGEASGPVAPPAPTPSESGPGSGCCQRPEGSTLGSLCFKGAVETDFAYGADQGVEGGAMSEATTTQDAPAYATAGFKKPVMAEPGCVQRSVRIPSDLLDHVTGPITVKFAVDRDGNPGRFEVMSYLFDQRVADAILRGVMACKWKPGADAHGRPASIWVIMPLRFKVD